MKVGIYALRDKKANFFNHLDLFENNFIALREYTLLLESKKMRLSDYDILYLGCVDTTSTLPTIENNELQLVDIERTLKNIQDNIKKF